MPRKTKTSTRYAVLALDQSSHTCGWSSWLDGQLEGWGEYEIMDYPTLDNFRGWIREFLEQFEAEGYLPVVVAETIYLGLNPQTFKVLAWMQGNLNAAVRDVGRELVFISPNEALKTLTGKSKLKRVDRKKAMIEAASKIAGKSVSNDEADAIGLGYAYLNKGTEK